MISALRRSPSSDGSERGPPGARRRRSGLGRALLLDLEYEVLFLLEGKGLRYGLGEDVDSLRRIESFFVEIDIGEIGLFDLGDGLEEFRVDSAFLGGVAGAGLDAQRQFLDEGIGFVRDERQLFVDLQAGLGLLGFEVEIGEIGLDEGLVDERSAIEIMASASIDSPLSR